MNAKGAQLSIELTRQQVNLFRHTKKYT